MRVLIGAVCAAFASVCALPASADFYLARCKMGDCRYVDQISRKVTGQGSDAVPGEFVTVGLRIAGADREGLPAHKLQWGDITNVEVFCSRTRPAIASSVKGAFEGVDVVTPVGANLFVTSIYYHACHPDKGIEVEPFSALKRLGYKPTAGKRYGTRSALLHK